MFYSAVRIINYYKTQRVEKMLARLLKWFFFGGGVKPLLALINYDVKLCYYTLPLVFDLQMIVYH